MHRRFTLLIAAVAVLSLAVAVPTASAGPKTDRAQNKKLRSHSKSIKKNSSSIKKNRAAIRRGANAVKKIDASGKSATNAIKSLQVLADRADKNASTVLAAAPQIIKGLTDLKTGLLAAGAGLNSLKTLATSQEYAVGQVFIAGTPAAGSFVVTPDIPDAVQQAQTSQTFVAGAAGAITLQVAVRSNESDGTGATNPAAFCRATTVSGANSTTSAPSAGPNPLAPAPFHPINDKSPQTSTTETSFPFGPISTDVLTDLSTGGNSVNPTGTPSTAVAGAPYTVSLTCVDPSASATDPSA